MAIGGSTNAVLHLTAIAVQTERIGLGSVVNCVYHRHPVMLARLAADLDHISGGRVVLGLGIGWNEVEFAQLGIPFPTVPARQQALEEAIQINPFNPLIYRLLGDAYAALGDQEKARMAQATLERLGASRN